MHPEDNDSIVRDLKRAIDAGDPGRITQARERLIDTKAWQSRICDGQPVSFDRFEEFVTAGRPEKARTSARENGRDTPNYRDVHAAVAEFSGPARKSEPPRTPFESLVLWWGKASADERQRFQEMGFEVFRLARGARDRFAPAGKEKRRATHQRFGRFGAKSRVPTRGQYPAPAPHARDRKDR